MQPTEEAPLHHVGVTTRESAAVVGHQLHGGLRRHNQPTSDTNTELGKMKRQNYVLNLGGKLKPLEEELSKVEMSNLI